LIPVAVDLYQSLMTDAKAASEPARLARDLMRQVDRATLATLSAEGWPYASLVLVAGDASGRPLLLLSDLAAHTRNLRADGRVSLLFDGTAGLDDPLTGPRLTVLGHSTEAADPVASQSFLARHPGASLYAGFADFRFYRIEPIEAHLVAGFGRIHRLAAADILDEPAV
jgi:putative heme iron utilization protein